jgi:hypothetical protein
MVKDKYGYTTDGGYIGMSRSSRNKRFKNMEKKYFNSSNNGKLRDEPISNKIIIPIYLSCLIVGILTILRRLNIL